MFLIPRKNLTKVCCYDEAIDSQDHGSIVGTVLVDA